MGSETAVKLPIIDFRGLKPESSEWETVKKQVREAAEEYGCFQALFDGIPENLRNSTFDGLKEIFDLPTQDKMRTTTDKPYQGYISLPVAPLYESMSIDDITTPENIKNFINLIWPQGNPPISNSIESFSKQLSQLDETVRRILLESLGLKKYIEEHLNSSTATIRISKYKGTQNCKEPKMGLPIHTDDNYLTILSENGVSGLEVKTKDGCQWISAEITPNSYIVLIGESLHAWTNGRLHSAEHRVMMGGENDRYSFGLFNIPKKGYTIKVPDEMVDEDHPLAFKPFDFADFIASFSFSETGVRTPANVKAYCGL